MHNISLLDVLLLYRSASVQLGVVLLDDYVID